MKKPKHILVIRLSAMGDVAMMVPVLRLLTHTYPELIVTLLSRKQFEPLFRELKHIHFLEAEVKKRHKGVFGLLKLAKEAHKEGIDSVADLHNVIRSKVITKRLQINGLQTATIDKGRAEKQKLTQAQGMGLVQLKSTHQRYADVFEKLGFPIDLSSYDFPKRKSLSNRLLQLIGNEPKKCIGIAPFAAYQSKMYSLDLMKELIFELDKRGNYHVLLFGGGANEVKILQEIENQLENVTNVAGALTFEEELDLISNLDMMLAMDSANGHLAANYGIPVLTLWGVTHPYAGFVPFNQPMDHQLMADRNKFPLIPTSIYGNKCPEGYEDAINTITPLQVLSKIDDILT